MYSIVVILMLVIAMVLARLIQGIPGHRANPLFLLVGMVAGCVVIGVRQTHADPPRENTFEVTADMPTLLKASASVLRARGYAIDVSGAAGIVVGLKFERFNAAPLTATTYVSNMPIWEPRRWMSLRQKVNIRLSKKIGPAGVTEKPTVILVEIDGTDTLSKTPVEKEKEALPSTLVSELRVEIARAAGTKNLVGR
jgi:hypothetical protein